MLAINIGTLSPLFLTFIYLMMARCSYVPILVIYLMLITMRVTILIVWEGQVDRFLNLPPILLNIFNGTLLANQALSLSINIYATSMITVKAWCVRIDLVYRVLRKYKTDSALFDDITYAYMQEIS